MSSITCYCAQIIPRDLTVNQKAIILSGNPAPQYMKSALHVKFDVQNSIIRISFDDILAHLWMLKTNQSVFGSVLYKLANSTASAMR